MKYATGVVLAAVLTVGLASAPEGAMAEADEVVVELAMPTPERPIVHASGVDSNGRLWFASRGAAYCFASVGEKPVLQSGLGHVGGDDVFQLGEDGHLYCIQQTQGAAGTVVRVLRCLYPDAIEVARLEGPLGLPRKSACITAAGNVVAVCSDGVKLFRSREWSVFPIASVQDGYTLTSTKNRVHVVTPTRLVSVADATGPDLLNVDIPSTVPLASYRALPLNQDMLLLVSTAHAGLLTLDCRTGATGRLTSEGQQLPSTLVLCVSKQGSEVLLWATNRLHPKGILYSVSSKAEAVPQLWSEGVASPVDEVLDVATFGDVTWMSLRSGIVAHDDEMKLRRITDDRHARTRDCKTLHRAGKHRVFGVRDDGIVLVGLGTVTKGAASSSSTPPVSRLTPRMIAWRLPLPPDRVIADTAFIDDRIAIASIGRDASDDEAAPGEISVIDARRGTIVSRHTLPPDTGFPVLGLTTRGDFVSTRNTTISTIDTRIGKVELVQVRSPGTSLRLSAATVEGDYIAACENGVARIDQEGKVTWRKETRRKVAQPFLVGDTVVVMSDCRAADQRSGDG